VTRAALAALAARLHLPPDSARHDEYEWPN
jgi:hypothetical protein